jgi:hypothetical protein
MMGSRHKLLLMPNKRAPDFSGALGDIHKLTQRFDIPLEVETLGSEGRFAYALPLTIVDPFCCNFNWRGVSQAGTQSLVIPVVSTSIQLHLRMSDGEEDLTV